MAKQPATADPMDALRDALAKKLESSATVVRSATAPVAVSPTPPTVAPAPATPTVSTPIAPTAKVMPPTLTRENLGERLRRSMPAGTIGYETMTMSEMAKIGGQYTNEYALLRSPIVRDGKMLEVGKNNNGQSVGVSILSVIARIHNKTGIDFQKVSRAVDYSGLLSWYTDESKSREVFIVMKFGTGNDATYDYLFRKDIEDNIDSILEMMQVYTDKNNNEGDRQAAVNALNQEILNVVNKGKVKRQVVGVMDMCGTDILQRCKDAFELLNK